MACNSYAGGNYLYCYPDYYLLCLIVCLIILKLATTSSLGGHPPYPVENTDTMYLGDQY